MQPEVNKGKSLNIRKSPPLDDFVRFSPEVFRSNDNSAGLSIFLHGLGWIWLGLENYVQEFTWEKSENEARGIYRERERERGGCNRGI